jgi:hypothetical protein
MAFNIGVAVRLTLDEGYDPPQGRCGGLPDACTQTHTPTTPLLAMRQHAQRERLSCIVRCVSYPRELLSTTQKCCVSYSREFWVYGRQRIHRVRIQHFQGGGLLECD